MSNGESSHGDDWNEEEDYHPSAAFALVAHKQAKELLDAATSAVETCLSTSNGANRIAASARKSSMATLADAEGILSSIHDAYLAAQQCEDATEQVDLAVHGLAQIRNLVDRLTTALSAANTEDLLTTPPSTQPIDPESLSDPKNASQGIASRLSRWTAERRGNGLGDALVIKATPGVGKTRAMLHTACAEQAEGQRVAIAVKTRDMITGSSSEIKSRVQNITRGRRVHLSVLVGRDPHNCENFEAVESVMAHGYAPGRAVCHHCDHYPDNVSMTGLAICGYYEERMRAQNLCKAAERGWSNDFPILLTTHASYVSAMASGGGRWGKIWATNLVMFDEDITDAVESDVHLSVEQCGFTSTSEETQSAGLVAHLFREACALGAEERKIVSDNGFRSPGKKERNTHPIHSRYDSSYTGEALFDLLERALQRVALTQDVGPLGYTLREVTLGEAFSVHPGSLSDVTSPEEINAMGIPPQSLSTVASQIHIEMLHAMKLRRILYRKVRGEDPTQSDYATLSQELRKHTDVSPLSYAVRLECLPADRTSGLKEDIWQFVVREFRSLGNTSATVVVGDAYAVESHYESILERPVEMLDVTASLHPGSHVTKVIDSRCSISQLKAGGLQPVLGFVESSMRTVVRPGDRVLLYGHQSLREKVEEWFGGVAKTLGVDVWKYEHWWGGRGKDQYNGWEHTFCISDPVLSLSGVKHVANARALRCSKRTDNPLRAISDGELQDIVSSKHGAPVSLRQSGTHIALEHDRMNVAEVTQAMHRSRMAHNPVHVFVMGEMESSTDLAAQTQMIVLPTSRNAKCSKPRSRMSKGKERAFRLEGGVSGFVTQEEALRCVTGIIQHFGCYSSWFAHSMVQSVPLCHDLSVERTDLRDFSLGIRVPASVLREHPIKTEAGTPHLGTSVDASGGPFGIRRVTDLLPGGEAGEVADDPYDLWRVQSDARTTIERVWNPPVYWRQMNAHDWLPKQIRNAHTMLSKTMPSVRASKLPPWTEGLFRGGPRPLIYYDPEVLPVHEALKMFYEIIDQQYGPVRGGQLVRPRAVAKVPTGFHEVPF